MPILYPVYTVLINLRDGLSRLEMIGDREGTRLDDQLKKLRDITG